MSYFRLYEERRFHDHQAAERARALRPEDYLVDDASYVHHETWIASAFDMLGDLRGKRVLDLGCGHGMASVVLARRGAAVTACDLSIGYLKEARTRARFNGVAIPFVACDGERLPFADSSFDRIWGNAVLHHLELGRAAVEIDRVLAPGGLAVFCEPWGENRWLNFARQRLPYPGKNRTDGEAPWRPPDLRKLREVFPDLKASGHQLLSMLGRVIKTKRVASLLRRCDEFLLGQLPRWQRYCRYVVVTLPKQEGKSQSTQPSLG